MLERRRIGITGWKLRQFGVAACRLLSGHFTSTTPEHIITLAEQLAEKDGEHELIRSQITDRVREVCRECDERLGPRTWLMSVVGEVLKDRPEAVNLASVLLSWRTAEQAFQESLLLIRAVGARLTGANIVLAQLIRCIWGNPFRPVVFDPNWRSETAVALATGIYAERAFDRLPILADALEEAGCDQPDMLDHCRGLGPHARGCWVVDAVIGKG